ncbi:MAG TPA: hypothetical protein VLW52_06625 [Opitutaceae bacterium]|nr:hypothetical protein [Opitutaceae bacterium]
MPVIPAYVAESPKRVRPSIVGAADGRATTLPLAGSVYRVDASGALSRFAPTAPTVDRKQVAAALLRFISARIAEHYGHNAMLATKVVWLCFDAKKLRDNLRLPGTNKTEGMIQATELVSDLLSTAALVPKLAGADAIATPIHFVARFGDMAHRGSITLSQSDMAEFFAQGAGDPAAKEVMSVLNDLGVQLSP